MIPQRLLGVDFTSAPRPQKPIICAWAMLSADRADRVLTLTGMEACPDFASFRKVLLREPSWLGGFDLPFGLPSAFVAAQGWPAHWRGYTRAALALSRKELVARCRAYAACRPVGEKLAYRATDKSAGSRSAMWWMHPPVVLMYHAGIRCLLDAKVCIEPCYRRAGQRVAVEAYPGLLQKRLGVGPYKHDEPARQSAARRENRITLLREAVRRAPELIGCRVRVSAAQRKRMIDDPSGDRLDAFLCVLQAAYAWLRREARYGLPQRVPVREGWIVMA